MNKSPTDEFIRESNPEVDPAVDKHGTRAEEEEEEEREVDGKDTAAEKVKGQRPAVAEVKELPTEEDKVAEVSQVKVSENEKVRPREFFRRRSSKFADLVTLVKAPKSSEKCVDASLSKTGADTLKRLRSGAPWSLSSLETPSAYARKSRVAEVEDVLEDIVPFVFFHPREKRYLDGLRRKTIPRQTFALSLFLGLGVGFVVAIVLSIALRVV